MALWFRVMSMTRCSIDIYDIDNIASIAINSLILILQNTKAYNYVLSILYTMSMYHQNLFTIIKHHNCEDFSLHILLLRHLLFQYQLYVDIVYIDLYMYITKVSIFTVNVVDVDVIESKSIFLCQQMKRKIKLKIKADIVDFDDISLYMFTTKNVHYSLRNRRYERYRIGIYLHM